MNITSEIARYKTHDFLPYRHAVLSSAKHNHHGVYCLPLRQLSISLAICKRSSSRSVVVNNWTEHGAPCSCLESSGASSTRHSSP